MRKYALILALGALALVPILGSRGSPGYAQSFTPQSDDFNASGFTAPFIVKCGQFALASCPDAQGANTWSLNGQRAGYLRIMTQLGSLVGTSQQSSNNARNFIVQATNPGTDYTVTTSLSFPGAANNVQTLGQSAGLLVYQDDDNFISFGRVLEGSGPLAGQSALEFRMETNGTDLVQTVQEAQGIPISPIFLRIVKTGSLYMASYSYDNVTFTPVGPGLVPTATPTSTTVPTSTPTSTTVPTATNTPTGTLTPTAVPTSTLTPTATNTPLPTVTSTPVPTGYSASYFAPQVGVFAWGGTNAAVVSSVIPADFDFFRSGNPEVPGQVATPTPTGTVAATNTPTITNTPLPTATGTLAPTSTATATSVATATTVPTATVAPTATTRPIPTPTPRPTQHKKPVTTYSYVSIWYHVIRIGTREHLEVQAKRHVAHGLWVHVIFPSGLHYDYYINTDANGFWATDFAIPPANKSLSNFSNQALVTFQLWKGAATNKTFDTFTILK